MAIPEKIQNQNQPVIMPIKKENRNRYPKYWKALSIRLRTVRAKNECECVGQCGKNHGPKCTAKNYQSHPVTGSKVILTVAHLDHTPENCAEDNLVVMCQDCHLRYDRIYHQEERTKTFYNSNPLLRNECQSIYLSRFACKSTQKLISKKKYNEKRKVAQPQITSQTIT